MELFLPTNDDDRIALLRQMANKAQQDADNDLFLISARSQERLAEFTERFASTLWRVREKRERQTQHIQEADAAIEALRNAIYNVWHQLRWQLEWGEINAHGLEYYGLDRQGRQPKIVGRSGWVDIGHKILTGDEMASAQGYPGMEDSIVFGQVYNQAKEIVDRLAVTKVELSKVTGQLNKLRRESPRVSRRAVTELRLSLSAEAAPRRRNILRGYGVQFVTSTTDEPMHTSAEEPVIYRDKAAQDMPNMIPQPPGAESQVAAAAMSYTLPTPNADNGVKPIVNGHDVA